MNINQRNIMIGDYADIPIDGKIYRYYIIKIDARGITIAQFDDTKRTLLLTNINNLWQISGQISGQISNYTGTFTKNITDTKYWERNFNSAPTKYILIAIRPRAAFRNYCVELGNGMLLYSLESNASDPGMFGLADPSNVEAKPSSLVEKCRTILEVQLLSRGKSSKGYTMMNLDGEIFIYLQSRSSIVKLNSNDLTFTEYDKNPQYNSVHPLKDKKILCMLNDNNLCILDLKLKQKIIIPTPTTFYPFYPYILQFSNGDVLLGNTRYSAAFGYIGDFYRMDIQNGSFTKIASRNKILRPIAILKDDEFLIYNYETSSVDIQIWNITTSTFTNILNERRDRNLIHLVLANGDILFQIDKTFGLFTYESKQINLLTSFKEIPYTQKIKSFQQLRNGNLLINNGKYLTIVEFPLTAKAQNMKNYQEITPNIKNLPPDMLTLIRTYL